MFCISNTAVLEMMLLFIAHAAGDKFSFVTYLLELTIVKFNCIVSC